MLINEVCKKCSLTKKAVEYYIEQGLVVPTMQENGYRCFSEEDAERLKNVFPGYYGRYVCAHFAPYLNEPIVTDEQQAAFKIIIEFLDNTGFDIPEDLQKYFDEVLSEAITRCEDGMDGFVEKMSSGIQEAVQDPAKFLENNREVIENYMAYKESDEYKASPTYRLQESFRQFGKTSGYNDIFIPAMCRLSKSYREYQEKLKKADEKLLQDYPQYANIL